MGTLRNNTPVPDLTISFVRCDLLASGFCGQRWTALARVNREPSDVGRRREHIST